MFSVVLRGKFNWWWAFTICLSKNRWLGRPRIDYRETIHTAERPGGLGITSGHPLEALARNLLHCHCSRHFSCFRSTTLKRSLRGIPYCQRCFPCSPFVTTATRSLAHIDSCCQGDGEGRTKEARARMRNVDCCFQLHSSRRRIDYGIERPRLQLYLEHEHGSFWELGDNVVFLVISSPLMHTTEPMSTNENGSFSVINRELFPSERSTSPWN